ncbi:hypothetical protein [Nonomuraea dietziae]|uniref:MFS transporter n=1 Tax=Nonomuraea dietziae TaxID=65515 RepID=UPI0031DD3BB7
MTLARLVAVCAVWGVFWGSWSALLPAVQTQVGATNADLGLALAGVPVGAIPAMALTGRLVRGRERIALAVSTALFALAAAGIGLVTTPLALGLALVGLGAASGALDIALNTATGRAERESGGRLFQTVHAAFPVAVIVAAPATGLARSLGYGPAQVLAVIAVLVLACAALAMGLPLGRGVQPVADSRPKGGLAARPAARCARRVRADHRELGRAVVGPAAGGLPLGPPRCWPARRPPPTWARSPRAA